MPNNTKTIHLMDKDAIEWYDKQTNKYQYITDLLLKDKREKEQYVRKDEIDNIINNAVEEILKRCEIVDNKIKINKPFNQMTRDEITAYLNKNRI